MTKSRLTSAEKEVVKKAYKDAQKAVIPQSIKYSNEAEKDWYRNHGYSCSEMGFHLQTKEGYMCLGIDKPHRISLRSIGCLYEFKR